MIDRENEMCIDRENQITAGVKVSYHGQRKRQTGREKKLS